MSSQTTINDEIPSTRALPIKIIRPDNRPSFLSLFRAKLCTYCVFLKQIYTDEINNQRRTFALRSKGIKENTVMEAD